MIGTLFLSLIERLGLIVTFAFFISKTVLFKDYLTKEKTSWPESIFLQSCGAPLGLL